MTRLADLDKIESIDIDPCTSSLNEGDIINVLYDTSLNGDKEYVVQYIRPATLTRLLKCANRCDAKIKAYPTAFELVCNIFNIIAYCTILFTYSIVARKACVYYLVEDKDNLSIPGNVTRDPGEKGLLICDPDSKLYKHRPEVVIRSTLYPLFVGIYTGGCVKPIVTRVDTLQNRIANR